MKRERQSGYRSVGQTNVCHFFYRYAMSDTFLLHVWSTQARHTRAAQRYILPVQIIQILRLQPVCAGKRVARHCSMPRVAQSPPQSTAQLFAGSGEPPARFGCLAGAETPQSQLGCASPLRGLQPSGGRKTASPLFICRYINRCKFSENRVE